MIPAQPRSNMFAHVRSVQGSTGIRGGRLPKPWDRNAASRARPNPPADFALLLKIVSRVEPGRSCLLQRTCAGDEPRTIRLFGRRHYRLSDIWSRHYDTFARYGASSPGFSG
jgi:hypothetical protein